MDDPEAPAPAGAGPRTSEPDLAADAAGERLVDGAAEREPDAGGGPAPAFGHPWADPARDWSVTPSPTSHSGPAASVERHVLGGSRWVDRLQSGFPPTAFVYAVFKKYSDDEGSRLAALLAYYTFLSLFPLLVLGFAIVNTILVDRPDLVLQLVADIVPPDYQAQVIDAYTSLPDSGPAFAIALVGLLLSGTGGAFAFYAMVNQVFAVPYRFRYGFGPRYLRVFLVLIVGALGVLLVTVGTAVAANFAHFAAAQRFGVLVLVWLAASSVLYLSASVLTRVPLGFAVVGPGAALGGVAITLILSLGSALVTRMVSSSSAVYGAFGTVVGIFSVLFLGSNAIVLCFEFGVVRAWRLWPRGIDIHLLFPADQRAYAILTIMDERMPSQRNGVQFDASGHDDPRRPDRDALIARPDGVPLRPYDVATSSEDAAVATEDVPTSSEDAAVATENAPTPSVHAPIATEDAPARSGDQV